MEISNSQDILYWYQYFCEKLAKFTVRIRWFFEVNLRIQHKCEKNGPEKPRIWTLSMQWVTTIGLTVSSERSLTNLGLPNQAVESLEIFTKYVKLNFRLVKCFYWFNIFLKKVKIIVLLFSISRSQIKWNNLC